MNENVRNFANQQMIETLSKCTDAQQHLFKRMYADGKMELSISEVVEKMPEDRLCHAQEQIDRTLSKM